jgi:hypothetical protein
MDRYHKSVFIIVFGVQGKAVLFCYRTKNTAGVANSQAVWWNIPCDNGACTDNTPFPYAYFGQMVTRPQSQQLSPMVTEPALSKLVSLPVVSLKKALRS